jgi:hypothetical protein
LVVVAATATCCWHSLCKHFFQRPGTNVPAWRCILVARSLAIGSSVGKEIEESMQSAVWLICISFAKRWFSLVQSFRFNCSLRTHLMWQNCSPCLNFSLS